MIIAGATHQFLGDVLPQDFRREIFEMVEAAWKRVGTAWLEPRITGLLQQAIIAEQETRYKVNPPFLILEDIKRRDPKTGKEIERSDLDFHLRNYYIKGQRPYFVFESKRLNIPYEKGVKVNADEYIGDGGMGCLLAGQYETAPSFSGMLAFVMDGKLAKAKAAVEAAILQSAKELKLQGPHQIRPSNLMPNDKFHGETCHTDGTGNFLIFHMFLAIVSKQ